MKKAFENKKFLGKNEASGQVLPTPQSRSNRNQHDGGARMADNSQYTDSYSGNNPEQNVNWQSIGELAARLVRK